MDFDSLLFPINAINPLWVSSIFLSIFDIVTIENRWTEIGIIYYE